MNDRSESYAAADSHLAGQLLEMIKHLEVANKKNLRIVLRTLTTDYRAQRLEAIGKMLQVLVGQLAAAGLILGFTLLAFEMVKKGESGYAVLLVGMPASSIAAIFVLRKMPDFKAMSSFARQVNAMAANTAPTVPPQAGSPPAAAGGIPPAPPTAGSAV
ncbi:MULTISPECIES: hypothetical protein [Streptomyces]|uniref:Uncharacterized protein n=1 Tax=Streptomyces lichenis TaxID=2306967 RepID=A0ABT0IGV5_9ACTN|nr:hypothetical protein [Streptomyces lichenis]MCK8680561.1 hypothetical protein [Streptomyces lichenis]